MVERNDVCAEETVQKVTPARQFLKHFRRGKRRVQENAYCRARKASSKQRRPDKTL
jgi:hypothetical protein